MEALKRSIAWDEEAYGRSEYDLIFYDVAVDEFQYGGWRTRVNYLTLLGLLASPETNRRQCTFV